VSTLDAAVANRAAPASGAPAGISPSFFEPSSIAIIGASSDSTRLSGRPLEVLRQHAFGGQLYVVNPNHAEVGGLPTYRSIADVPGPVDLALIVLPAKLVLDAVEACAACRVANVVIFSSGFAEASGGHSDLEARIGDIARTTGTRIAGPNCEGYLNVVAGVAAGFSPAIDYDHGLEAPPRPGPVAIVSQSGGLGFAIMQAGLARGVGFSYVVSTGNEADLEALDYLDYFIDDPETRVVAMFVEGFKSAPRFPEIAARARANGTQIVIAKVGRSEAGRRAAVSHTGHMAGRDVAYDAAFRRFGALRVHDPIELVDVLVATSRYPSMSGNRVGVLTVSGGAGAWVADALELAGFDVPELDGATRDALTPLLPSYGSATNPVDATAQILDSANLAEALRVLTDTPNLDAVVVAISLAAPAIIEREEHALRAVIAASTKPVLFYSYTAVAPGAAVVLERLGVPWYDSPTRTVGALSALRAIGRMQPSADEPAPPAPAPDGGPVPMVVPPSPAGRRMCEFEVNAILASRRINVPDGELATSEDDAVAVAARLGVAVAVKVQSPDALHKREVGGVVLGVSGEHAVRAAYRTVTEGVRSRVPGAVIHGVLVQEMMPPGLEMMIGRLEDDQFGPLIAVGRGGSNVELHGDVVYDLAPVDPGGALRMLQRLQVWPLLSRQDVGADELAALVSEISRLEVAGRGRFVELDLNPVMVYPHGEGVAVVDAKAVIADD
jgi:acyl-CoA synthetase (NDP forming)